MTKIKHSKANGIRIIFSISVSIILVMSLFGLSISNTHANTNSTSSMANSTSSMANSTSSMANSTSSMANSTSSMANSTSTPDNQNGSITSFPGGMDSDRRHMPT